ncbi:MAG: hypothetical protein ACLFTQ_01495 [Candidatus Aenigmatarchaeota archaeon]
MFLRFDEKKCPICGTVGKDSSIKELNQCPRCGTRFNQFGIIASYKKDRKLQWT